MYTIGQLHLFAIDNGRTVIAATCFAITLKSGVFTYHFRNVLTGERFTV